ncbi:MAG TPA: mechanosensitive ion channel domain-containing protein [Actinomycetota bacterium]|nr:mechanosensitive ion channel domain-containing protein [Actinomycetota bacterium]
MTTPLARTITLFGEKISLTGIITRGLALVAVLVLGVIVYAVGKTVIRRVSLPKYPFSPTVAARAETTRSLLLSVWKYVVLVLVVGALLMVAGVTFASGLVLTGAAGLVVAFGAQTLFKDVIAGFSILMEGQFAVGDRVSLLGADIEGVVEGVGLRITVIREDDGSRVFVPNGGITAVRTLPPAAATDAGRATRPARGRSTDRTRPSSRREPRQDSPRPAAETSRSAPSAAGASGAGSRTRPPQRRRGPAPLTDETVPPEAPARAGAQDLPPAGLGATTPGATTADRPDMFEVGATGGADDGGADVGGADGERPRSGRPRGRRGGRRRGGSRRPGTAADAAGAETSGNGEQGEQSPPDAPSDAALPPRDAPSDAAPAPRQPRQPRPSAAQPRQESQPPAAGPEHAAPAPEPAAQDQTPPISPGEQPAQASTRQARPARTQEEPQAQPVAAERRDREDDRESLTESPWSID